MALYGADPAAFGAVRAVAQLYHAWLHRHLAPHGAEAEADLRHMEALAWDMCRRGLVADRVGARGRPECRWFRRCPLWLEDYNPRSFFPFLVPGLREFLAAHMLWRGLRAPAAEAGAEPAVVRGARTLSEVALAPQVVELFGGLCRALCAAADRAALRRRLRECADLCRTARGGPDPPIAAADVCVANASALLGAVGE